VGDLALDHASGGPVASEPLGSRRAVRDQGVAGRRVVPVAGGLAHRGVVVVSGESGPDASGQLGIDGGQHMAAGSALCRGASG
jgi:hypothetical protein